MRNARELYCMRVENVEFDAGTIFTPDSKTESGRRFIPISSRVKQILEERCAGRSEGWVWMSRYKGKHIGEGMVYRQRVRARQAAGCRASSSSTVRATTSAASCWRRPEI
jgi:integrase